MQPPLTQEQRDHFSQIWHECAMYRLLTGRGVIRPICIKNDDDSHNEWFIKATKDLHHTS